MCVLGFNVPCLRNDELFLLLECLDCRNGDVQEVCHDLPRHEREPAKKGAISRSRSRTYPQRYYH